MLISHLYGHLLRTVCSVSNSLIKINIKQIENIPRRGCFICWRILQKTCQSTEKTLLPSEAPACPGCAAGRWALQGALALSPVSLQGAWGPRLLTPRCPGRIYLCLYFFPSKPFWARRARHSPTLPVRLGAPRRGSPFVELIRGLLQQTSKLQLTRAACNPLAELR